MIRPRRAFAAAPAVVVAALALAPAASAVGTRYWTLRTPADYAQAELDGVAVGPEGTLARGPGLEAVELPQADVAWALLPDGDAIDLAVGPGGRVLTVRGGAVRADSIGDGQALSLARGPDGALYAGTGPSGRVVRLAGGRATTWFETGQRYVWGLAFVGRTLYAATGPLGRLYAIDGEGRGRVVFESPGGQLTALAPDGQGGLFFGAAGRGLVYRLVDGRVRALFEAPEKEIRALAYDGHALYVAAMSAPAMSFDDATNEPEPSSGEGQRSVVYRVVPDSTVAVHWVSPQGLIYGLALHDGALWVATGSRAGLYRVDARGAASALWNGGEGEATAIASLGGDRLALATANPARLYRLRAGAGAGTALSPVLDAHRIARWGRLWWEGDDGGARFRTRSGNTADPDSTWSDWVEPAAGGRVASPPARYLQWQARLGTGDARLRAVTVAWGEVNQAPHIDQFTVYPTPGRFYEGDLNIRRDPITQELPDGRKVQFNVDVPRKSDADALPSWAQGMRPMSWKAQDPNGDDLTYRLFARPEGAGAWTPVAAGLTNTLYAWDTTGWPDGRYEVRLVASDEDVNPFGAGRTDEAIARDVVVDRTPPRIAALDLTVAGDVITVRGRAADSGGWVSRVDVALDDGDWFPATPDDGLWDSAEEGFSILLEGVPAGSRLVRVRAVDALGNDVTATRTVQIGR